jgi:hypothetical protein
MPRHHRGAEVITRVGVLAKGEPVTGLSLGAVTDQPTRIVRGRFFMIGRMHLAKGVAVTNREKHNVHQSF